jgi:undecaprenyl-diphosphatase
MKRHVRKFLGRRLSSEEYLGLHLTIGLFVCLLLVSLFSLIARDLVGEQTLTEFDTDLGRSFEQHRLAHPWFRQVLLAITQFGSPLTILALAILVALAMLVRRRRRLALAWLLALLASGLLNLGLKEAFNRDRPPFHDRAIRETTESFPSGHAMGAITTYGLLAYLLVLRCRSRCSRIIVVFLLSGLILAIGVSRVYLGAHYFSDVAGGFAVGGAWLAACISGIEVSRRRSRRRRGQNPRFLP